MKFGGNLKTYRPLPGDVNFYINRSGDAAVAEVLRELLEVDGNAMTRLFRETFVWVDQL